MANVGDPASQNPSNAKMLPASGDVSQEEAPPPPLPKIPKLPTSAPLDWLKRGWKDFTNTRFKGAFYGLVFVLMGYAIVWVYATKWQLTMGLIGGGCSKYFPFRTLSFSCFGQVSDSSSHLSSLRLAL